MSEISEKGYDLMDDFAKTYADSVSEFGAGRASVYAEADKARKELQDYISALEAENAALKEELRWIPVSEWLPEGGSYLVLLKNGKITIDETYIDGGRWYWWNSGTSNVTHWMPLPEPPEVQE